MISNNSHIFPEIRTSEFWQNDTRIQIVIVYIGTMGDNTGGKYFLKLLEANPPYMIFLIRILGD